MISIRKKLGASFITTSILTIIFIIIVVNVVINIQFKKYMNEVQEKRYNSVVTYFEEIYKKEKNFSIDSGNELIHEAFMNNYCLTLMDSNKNIIWGMNPDNLVEDFSFNNMHKEEKGVFTSKIFNIKYDNEIVGYIEIGQYSSILLTEEDTAFITSINKSIIISTLLTICIVILISIYLSKQFSKPISEVSKISAQLSQGNFNIKFNGNTKIREMDKLKASINTLSEKLNNQDLLRRQLVSDISHEIRTPLNVLQNNLEAMIDGVFPITVDRLMKLNSEVIRFGNLLENLDVLKDFESKNYMLSIRKVNLEEVILDIYKEFLLEAHNKNIALTCEIDKNNNYIINGDKDKLRQVFINIINNSIKFNRVNGEVNICLMKEGKRIIIIIKDSGIGISQKDLPYIFERLYRVDKSRNCVEGSGIGLTIVKSILKGHNADIFVESEVGKGSVFKIIF